MSCDSQTVLMLHANGSDGSTTFTDSSISNKTVTPAGNAQIDTAQSKFGGSSALFDGTGDQLSIADSADWDFGTGDFTIDFWLRFNTSLLDVSFVDRNDGDDFRVSLIGGTFRFGMEGTDYNNTAWSPSNGVWYHIACVRSGTNVYVFINGTQLGSTGSSSADIQGTAAVLISGNSLIAQDLDGWMDEIRISKGVARWTANFTPPTTEYCGSTNNLQVNSGRGSMRGTMRGNNI